MGIALKVPGIDFSGANLGRVTPADPTILTSIDIVGADVAYGEEQYAIAYTPAGTIHTGVSWSIVSGGNYASIDQNGTLTPASGIAGQVVRIKAISTYDPSITSTKDVTIYSVHLMRDSGVSFKQTLQTSIIPPALSAVELDMRYKVKSIPASGYGFMMGSRNGDSAGTATDAVAVFMVGGSSEKANGMLGATGTGNAVPVATDVEYLFKMNKNGVNVNGIDYAFTGSVGSVNPTRPIWLGKVNQPTPNSASIEARVLFNYIILKDGDSVVAELVPYYESANDYGLFDTIGGVKYDIHSLNQAEFAQDFDAA